MIDAVLTYHTNSLACGVCKFNQQLAQRLNVACLPLFPGLFASRLTAHPLLSLKASELTDGEQAALSHAVTGGGSFDVLWHDAVEIPAVSARADHVWQASQLGCPSTLQGNPSRGSLNVLTFGMAHKTHEALLTRLCDLLERTAPDYTLSVTTAIHEGSPWEETFAWNMDLLRRVCGDHLRALGFLADDALAKELREVQAVALFYEPAARANNTTLWAALDAGTPTITNLDACSPSVLQHDVSVFDIAHLDEWPTADRLRVVRRGGVLASQTYGWDRLIATLTAPLHA